MKDTDDLVTFFANRNIPLALNHCVSIYPTENHDLQLNQVDYLSERYPDNTIGLSTHEYQDWETSLAIAYAKGARTFERHIDIDADGESVSPYCSQPAQIDTWFKAFKRAKTMCGQPGTTKRICPPEEIKSLDALVRGVYARYDLKAGRALTDDDVYLAIPLQKGQMSCREIARGQMLLSDIAKDAPVRVEEVDTPYAYDDQLKRNLLARGI